MKKPSTSSRRNRDVTTPALRAPRSYSVSPCARSSSEHASEDEGFLTSVTRSGPTSRNRHQSCYKRPSPLQVAHKKSGGLLFAEDELDLLIFEDSLKDDGYSSTGSTRPLQSSKSGTSRKGTPKPTRTATADKQETAPVQRRNDKDESHAVKEQEDRDCSSVEQEFRDDILRCEDEAEQAEQIKCNNNNNKEVDIYDIFSFELEGQSVSLVEEQSVNSFDFTYNTDSLMDPNLCEETNQKEDMQETPTKECTKSESKRSYIGAIQESLATSYQDLQKPTISKSKSMTTATTATGTTGLVERAIEFFESAETQSRGTTSTSKGRDDSSQSKRGGSVFSASIHYSKGDDASDVKTNGSSRIHRANHISPKHESDSAFSNHSHESIHNWSQQFSNTQGMASPTRRNQALCMTPVLLKELMSDVMSQAGKLTVRFDMLEQDGKLQEDQGEPRTNIQTEEGKKQQQRFLGSLFDGTEDNDDDDDTLTEKLTLEFAKLEQEYDDDDSDTHSVFSGIQDEELKQELQFHFDILNPDKTCPMNTNKTVVQQLVKSQLEGAELKEALRKQEEKSKEVLEQKQQEINELNNTLKLQSTMKDDIEAYLKEKLEHAMQELEQQKSASHEIESVHKEETSRFQEEEVGRRDRQLSLQQERHHRQIRRMKQEHAVEKEVIVQEWEADLRKVQEQHEQHLKQVAKLNAEHEKDKKQLIESNAPLKMQCTLLKRDVAKWKKLAKVNMNQRNQEPSCKEEYIAPSFSRSFEGSWKEETDDCSDEKKQSGENQSEELLSKQTELNMLKAACRFQDMIIDGMSLLALKDCLLEGNLLDCPDIAQHKLLEKMDPVDSTSNDLRTIEKDLERAKAARILKDEIINGLLKEATSKDKTRTNTDTEHNDERAKASRHKRRFSRGMFSSHNKPWMQPLLPTITPVSTSNAKDFQLVDENQVTHTSRGASLPSQTHKKQRISPPLQPRRPYSPMVEGRPQPQIPPKQQKRTMPPPSSAKTTKIPKVNSSKTVRTSDQVDDASKQKRPLPPSTSRTTATKLPRSKGPVVDQKLSGSAAYSKPSTSKKSSSSTTDGASTRRFQSLRAQKLTSKAGKARMMI